MTETLVQGIIHALSGTLSKEAIVFVISMIPIPRSASGGRTCAWCTGSKGNSALCAWQYHTGAIHSASDHTNLYLAERHEDF